MSEPREHRAPSVSLKEILQATGCVVTAGAAATVGGVAVLTTAGCSRSADEASEVPAAETQAVESTEALGATPTETAANQAPQPAAAAAPQGADDASDITEGNSSGFIDMNAVREAIEQASDTDDLEIRLNEIYTGAHAILLRIRNVEDEQHTEAWEDLDDSGTIEDASDDKLFSFILPRVIDDAAEPPPAVPSQPAAAPAAPTQATAAPRIVGHGVNEHYTHVYAPDYRPAGAFWTGFLVANLARPGWVWVTPPARRVVIINHRRAYRVTPAYATRRAATRRYFHTVRVAHPTWHPARVRYSPARVRFRGPRPPHPPGFRPVAPPRPRVIHPPRPRGPHFPPPPPMPRFGGGGR